MMRNPTLALLLLTFFGLAACGQKGPLYLPGDSAQTQTDLPSEIERLQEEDDDDDDDNGQR